jgi:hypothetical protein
MKKQKNGSGRHFSKNRKIPKELHFERSPWKLQAEYQKSVLPDFRYSMWKMKKIRLKTKKWLGAMFWQNWVNEKLVKFRPLSRPVDVCYSHISVH